MSVTPPPPPRRKARDTSTSHDALVVRDPGQSPPGSLKPAVDTGEPNMKTILKILFIPAVVFGLTAYGMWATVLAERHPSPIAKIGTSPATPLGSKLTDDERC